MHNTFNPLVYASLFRELMSAFIVFIGVFYKNFWILGHWTILNME